MPENETAWLLNDVGDFIREYIVCSPEQKDLLALWSLNTHCFGIAECVPYLAITAPVKRAGKTQLLEILSTVCARAWLTGRVTPAVLVRKIDSEMPTLLLDESDTTFNGNNQYSQALRGVLNTGYRRGGRVSVMQGGAIVDFSTYGPKAIAGIGQLPDTVADRAIPIRLERKLPTDSVGRLRLRDIEEESHALKLRMSQWVIHNRLRLRNARPTIPEELNDRAADVMEPLFAIADIAGEAWGDRARNASIVLFAPEIQEEDESILFKTIQEAWREDLGTRISSLQLCDMLSRDVGIVKMNPRKLAERLRAFGIRPTTVRLPDGRIVKGYKREAFDMAMERYA